MLEKIVISVVVPAYNEEKLIGRCLTSLTQQDFKQPFEIIVVNNNSTDKTAEIAKSFGVRLITEQLQGVVSARQRGLLAASGEIVVGADCDCIYPSTHLTNLYQHFQNPRVVAVGGPAIGEKRPFWAHLIYKFGFGLVALLYRFTGQVLYLGGFNFAYRRKTFLRLGGYRTYLDFGGDEWEPLARLKKVGKVIYDPLLLMYVSTRRYRVGFIRWFFVHNFYYYILNFWLARLFKKTLIHAPAVREK
ncbi:MAG: Glycosyl transferase [Candidatus Gottesmanbacteria bacterium GW2011_GWB1_43_11]|uniref:Glycosyl transferase n=1 Tax=Candidatus Gottesmanbacteria bacterium GW2011_GWB1_43_11 TaxID=1618446 RepID=A0A0G1CM02_9BACT|nr:MAG: Glycosyl transferase [Candidatus Gottesmanbacteria bacterium GW2011_GWA1_42_26]KKS80904.1 MAG: Glycosyl transferase [Candidatus Gottesmanbacteria bacterium GW2011_GWC1_43_10]KKS86537.1 MAG: Glycosyl transferase [Candidatus Gottesmanbacteria bacterium GW2011_GWB1_43_11]OGG07867.1 MAG: hypothetical protein A2699_02270 [Candidatus Gottesmanbacteria bacterium RIFCSPHIGHO2_01_FULL_43_15]OGG27880.1 MAG: hypothetical protein A3A59_00590 [Candidatus Gottesmanbacteria bacterium RIFCSPLOWO2_01_FU